MIAFGMSWNIQMSINYCFPDACYLTMALLQDRSQLMCFDLWEENRMSKTSTFYQIVHSEENVDQHAIFKSMLSVYLECWPFDTFVPQVFSGPLFTNRTDVSPQDLGEPQSPQIRISTFQIALKLTGTSKTAAEMLAKLQSDTIIIKSNLAASRLQEICR